MIWNSFPWKQVLLKNASWLERLSSKKKLTAQQDIAFEQKVFFAAYSIRKLFEAKKVCSIVPHQIVQCTSLSRTEKRITHYNWHNVERFFNFANPMPISLKAEALVNQIIHSYIFLPEGKEHFLVSSDRSKKDYLFRVSLREFCTLMREVGNDDPSFSILLSKPKQDILYITCPRHKHLPVPGYEGGLNIRAILERLGETDFDVDVKL